MQKILICEICREPIARFEDSELSLPINLQVFKSLYPERSVPDPFPAGLDDWTRAACPRCRRRPLFNHFFVSEGKYAVSSGEIVLDGEQWFVMVNSASNLPEKMLLSPKQPVTDDDHARLPPLDEQAVLSQMEVYEIESSEQIEVAPIEDDNQEPTGNYKSQPVSCPTCGKQFRSAGRMAKYHANCPSATSPQEGFKV